MVEFASIDTLFPSGEYEVRNGVLFTTVKSQHNSDPDYGLTQYEITIKYTPMVKRRGRGRGAARKCELDIPFELKCSCQAYNGLCKHLGAELFVNFN